jgi:hypothetical protein
MNYKVGDTVYWEDPDEGFSSGYYQIHMLPPTCEDGPSDDDIFVLTNEAGGIVEVLRSELN